MGEKSASKVISKDFIVELAKYFMLFLETDFKKRRQPKRNLSSRVNKGLQVGLYLDKYPPLHKEIYKNFITGFPKETCTISAKQFVTKIPDSLKDLVMHQIEKVSKETIAKLVTSLSASVEQARVDNQKQYDLFLEDSTNGIKQNLASVLTNPLIHDIEKPLQAAGLSTEAGLYQLEVDSTEKLYGVIEGSLETVLKKFFADNEKSKELEGYFKQQYSLDDVAKVLREFFEDFSTSDAYADIYQLHRNREMLDKTELYIYFCEISINNFSFPLFYTQVGTEHNSTDMTLEMDNRIFVNTKAIEFVIQEYNQQTGNREGLGNKFDRIIYIDDKKELLGKLQDYINDIAAVLDLDTIDLGSSSSQSKANLIIKLSNRLQLFLFDKSDEALINDYEEIIQDEGELTEAFTDLINGFVTENPEKFIERVAEEWDEQSIPKKLVMQSPIPLNEEQKQAMLALQKDNCNIVILEGPPGTGKSHTITAIVCKALLEGQSVLVLSDKEEALDVVQDKITDALNTVRQDKNFQNPLLRLGKTGGGLSKVIEGQVLDRVREHYRAYRANKESLEEVNKSRQKDAIAELQRVTDIGEKIDLNDIEKNEELAVKFEKYVWLMPDDAEEVGDEFKEIHKLIKTITSSPSNYLIQYLDTDLSKIDGFCSALDNYLDCKKDVDKTESNFLNEYKKLDESTRETLKNILLKFEKQGRANTKSLKDSGLLLFANTSTSTSFKSLLDSKKTFSILEDISTASNKYLSDSADKISPQLKNLSAYDISSGELIEAYQDYINSVRALKSKLFGFAGKKSRLDELARKLKKRVPYFQANDPEKHIEGLQLVADFVGFVANKIQQQSVDKKYWIDVVKLLTLDKKKRQEIRQTISALSISEKLGLVSDFSVGVTASLNKNIQLYESAQTLAKVVHESPTINKLIELTQLDDLLSSPSSYKDRLGKLQKDHLEAKELGENELKINKFFDRYPQVAASLGIQGSISLSGPDKNFLDMSSEEMTNYVNYLIKTRELEKSFKELLIDDYPNAMAEVELLTTAEMAHKLDSRIIEYVDENASDIRTLKSLLRSKQKFPRTLFAGLKQAFPCILAGIRDYATYIPLEQDLFDLVIIDEASQVSIAQALPALIRGKKILVLGDDKQFSNVKAGNASKLTNTQLKTQMISALKDSISHIDREQAQLYLSRARDNFDIKNSVLEFCRFISNYETMLKKHFRCYPEIISYSNKHFYGDNLQCMKARALPIGEVIKFDVVKDDFIPEPYLNTNTQELSFIQDTLMSMKDRNYEGTLGIITPHREQASLIHTTLTTSDLGPWLEDRRLKVMTFDTCQGEERDYIFYSMVATDTDDKLRYIFPASLTSADSDYEESRLRVQRLNVGFSRAKDTIHFILSKPVDQYWGEVRNALAFYEQTLKEAEKITVGGTDPNSGMEDKIQHYFYETPFYKDRAGKVELIPQFPLGSYLKSLNKNYHHPNFKVDFLLLVDGQKIVIEYDGFKEHFIDGEGLTKNNYMSYLREDDVYRQKVLEGYGYKFLRLNKFNLGSEPIPALNDLLVEIVKKKTLARNLLAVT